MSASGVKYFFAFVLLAIAGRLIYPFGDEPDFLVRVYRLQAVGLLNFFIEGVGGQCQPVVERGDVFATIPSECFNLNKKYFAQRFLFSMLSALPVILAIVFKNRVYSILGFDKYIGIDEWNKRITAIALSVVFPGMQYALGFLSKEAFVLVLSLFIFIFFGRYLLMLLLMLMLFWIDDGNATIVIVYVLTYVLFFTVYKLTSANVLKVIFLFFILFFYFFGVDALYLLSGATDISKIKDIIASGSELFDKHPLILRAIVTVLSGVFMTPSGVSSPMVFALVVFSLVVLGVKHLNRPSGNDSELLNRKLSLFSISPLVGVYSSIATVSMFVFSIPTYSWAKYYMFLLPFFIYAILGIVKENTMFSFFIVLNLVLYVNLTLYYLA